MRFLRRRTSRTYFFKRTADFHPRCVLQDYWARRGRLFAAHQHLCFSWSLISLQCPNIPARYIQVTKLSGFLVQLHFGNEAYYRKKTFFLTAHEHDATWKRHSIALYTPRNAVIYGFELLLWTRILFFRFLLHIRLANRVI